MSSVRDLVYARRAKKAGANYSLRVIMEARRAEIPLSLAFALIEQESNFRNVWGHDPSPNGGTGGIGGTTVTERRYKAYKKARGGRGQGGMQGVGPAQLTWYSYQDAADKLGGAWVPKYNIRVAFERLSALIKANGERGGIRRYNGSGPNAVLYADRVLAKQARWHKILLGK